MRENGIVTLVARLSLPIAAAGLVGAGCAQTTYRPASAGTNGIRYYAPATYILVKPDYENAKASVTFLTLPDTEQLYAVDSCSWMATNKTKIEFKNGMIAKSTSEIDGTKIPKAVLQASAAVGKELLAVAASTAKLAATTGAARAAQIDAPAAGGPPIFLFYSHGDRLTQVFPPPATDGE